MSRHAAEVGKILNRVESECSNMGWGAHRRGAWMRHIGFVAGLHLEFCSELEPLRNGLHE